MQKLIQLKMVSKEFKGKSLFILINILSHFCIKPVNKTKLFLHFCCTKQLAKQNKKLNTIVESGETVMSVVEQYFCRAC